MSSSDKRIIEVGDESTDVVVLSDGRTISMQVLQGVYNDLTGRTEELNRTYRFAHKTTFEDVNQLNHKVEQLYEQYSIVNKKCSVTIFTVDDQREVFSSFQRFEIFDKSKLSPVENLRITYEFLIVLPKNNKPQAYTLEIDIHSRVAIWKRESKEKGYSKNLVHIIGDRTGFVEIEYIDYTVARNFIDTVDNWFEGLDKTESSKLFEILRSASIHLDYIFSTFSAIVILLASWYIALPLFTSDSSNYLLFQSITLVLVILGISARISFVAGRATNRMLESVFPLSYLHLNKGDEKIIEEFNKNKKGKLVKAGITSIIGFGASILASLIATWITSA